MNTYLKQGLITLFAFSSLINPAYGESTSRGAVSMHAESLDDGGATSLRVYTEGDRIAYMGFSLNNIYTSSTPIQRNGRTSINPVYLFAGLRAPWKIAPFVEGGLDFGEKLINDLFQSPGSIDDDMDYYFSGGIKLDISDNMALSIYKKGYTFIFREDQFSPATTASQSGYGIELSMLF